MHQHTIIFGIRARARGSAPMAAPATAVTGVTGALFRPSPVLRRLNSHETERSNSRRSFARERGCGLRRCHKQTTGKERQMPDDQAPRFSFEVHPAAEAFPMLSEDELQQLAE